MKFARERFGTLLGIFVATFSRDRKRASGIGWNLLLTTTINNP